MRACCGTKSPQYVWDLNIEACARSQDIVQNICLGAHVGKNYNAVPDLPN